MKIVYYPLNLKKRKEKETGNILFQDVGIDLVFLLLLLNTTKNNPGHYMKNICRETWKDGEKTDQSGTSGPKELHGGEVSGFYFCLRYPKLVAEESGTQRHQLVLHRKAQ